MPLLHPDPRLDPALRPHQWRRALERPRRMRVGASLLVTGLVLGGLAYAWWYTRDLTAGKAPEAVVRSSASALLAADRYRFQVRLSGNPNDPYFPSATMAGKYQREPLGLHLKGEALSGGSTVNLEYFLDRSDLYVRNPTDLSWMLVRDANLDELHSFQPNALATPLLKGVRLARVVGREQLPGGEALRIDLDLHPSVLKKRLGGSDTGQVQYTLWVYTRSLRPARLAIDYKAATEEAAAQTGRSFAYVLDWDFRDPEPVHLPEEVRESAREYGQSSGTPEGER